PPATNRVTTPTPFKKSLRSTKHLFPFLEATVQCSLESRNSNSHTERSRPPAITSVKIRSTIEKPLSSVRLCRGFSGWDDCEALARIFGPRSHGIELDVSLPMFACFSEGVKLFAHKRQIIVGIAIRRIKDQSLAQVPAGLFQFAHFLQDAAKVEMRQGILRMCGKRALEILRGFLEISVFVIHCSAVQQCVGIVGIDVKAAIVSVKGLGPGFLVCFVRKRHSQPIVRAALGDDTHAVMEFARFK